MQVVRTEIDRQASKQLYQFIEADELTKKVFIGLYSQPITNAWLAFGPQALIDTIYQDWENDQVKNEYPVTFNGERGFTKNYTVSIDPDAIEAIYSDASNRADIHRLKQVKKSITDRQDDPGWFE